MQLKVAVYNMEWMRNLFFDGGVPKRIDDPDETHRELGIRSAKLAEIVNKLDADILGIVEGPNTLADGSLTASEQLESWRDLHGLNDNYRAVHGYPSGGEQELCCLYRSDKVAVEFTPETHGPRHPFNEPFLVDTTDTLIKEHYKHYRAPLELTVKSVGSPDKELTRLIVAHSKSKGIFDSVDLARFEQLSARNRRKLYAECSSIRERCDQWLSESIEPNVIVMGDINDGFGLDYYEQRLNRSAVETLLGDPWRPELILQHVLPKPKLKKFGWEPSSSQFTDRITGDRFNVLIDHLLVSRFIKVRSAAVWNPYLKDSAQDIKDLKEVLRSASDHFPVICECEIDAVSIA